MNKDLVAIFEYLEREKGIKRETVISAIEEALQLAARKSVKSIPSATVKVDPKTGDIEVTTEKEIVEKVTYPEEEITLEAARELDPDCELGQWIEISINPDYFGRIAAQTAKQVIAQKLRSAERDIIYEEFRHRVGEIVTGTIKRIVKSRTLIVDLGKVEAILPDRFIPKLEKYTIGERIMAYLLEVRDTEGGGAEAVLSRTHPELVEELFKQEVPEVHEGIIRIVRIVREAGYRSKVVVDTDDPKIDPVGACVGVRGARVKNIIRELGNEKIDIIPFTEDRIELLMRALSPIEIKKISESDDTVSIVVNDEDYPAALGKRGINARLNGQLLGVRLEIEKMTEHEKSLTFARRQLALSEDPSLDEPLAVEGVRSFVIDSLSAAGFDTPRKLLTATTSEIMKESGITKELAEEVLDKVKKNRDTSS
ncbi:MAG: transcription termination factor NusA [Simkaniaceae bacterium]